MIVPPTKNVTRQTASGHGLKPLRQKSLPNLGSDSVGPHKRTGTWPGGEGAPLGFSGTLGPMARVEVPLTTWAHQKKQGSCNYQGPQ